MIQELPGLKRLADCPICHERIYAPAEYHGILPPPKVSRCKHLTPDRLLTTLPPRRPS